MEVRAERVAVRGAHGPLLEPTSLAIEAGQLSLVRGEPGGGHTEFGLALTGRLRPSTGQTTVDGRVDLARLREISALVDAPGITEPEPNLTLTEMVAEELALHRRRASRASVRNWLEQHGVGEHARSRVEALPARVRTAVLTALAAERPGVELLVLDTPDRHTANTQAWWPLALRQAERGRSVVVLCSTASARLLPIPAARLGQDEQPEALTVRAT